MFVLLRRACAPRARIRSRYNMCLCFRLLGLAGHEAKSLLTLLKANAISLSPTPRRDNEKGCIVSAYLFARGCFLDTSVLSLTARGWRAWGKPDLSNIEIFSCLYKILYSSILGCRCIFFCGKTAAHGTNQLNNNCSHIIYFTFLPPLEGIVVRIVDILLESTHRIGSVRFARILDPRTEQGLPPRVDPALLACTGFLCTFSVLCRHQLEDTSPLPA